MIILQSRQSWLDTVYTPNGASRFVLWEGYIDHPRIPKEDWIILNFELSCVHNSKFERAPWFRFLKEKVQPISAGSCWSKLDISWWWWGRWIENPPSLCLLCRLKLLYVRGKHVPWPPSTQYNQPDRLDETSSECMQEETVLEITYQCCEKCVVGCSPTGNRTKNACV